MAFLLLYEQRYIHLRTNIYVCMYVSSFMCCTRAFILPWMQLDLVCFWPLKHTHLCILVYKYSNVNSRIVTYPHNHIHIHTRTYAYKVYKYIYLLLICWCRGQYCIVDALINGLLKMIESVSARDSVGKF